MGRYLNHVRKDILSAGKKTKHFIKKTGSTIRPYALATGRTILNNADSFPALGGIAAGVAGTSALIAGGQIPQAAQTGLATLSLAKRTLPSLKKSFKSELRNAKTKEGGRLKGISQDSVRKLRDSVVGVGKAKDIYKKGVELAQNYNE